MTATESGSDAASFLRQTENTTAESIDRMVEAEMVGKVLVGIGYPKSSKGIYDKARKLGLDDRALSFRVLNSFLQDGNYPVYFDYAQERAATRTGFLAVAMLRPTRLAVCQKMLKVVSEDQDLIGGRPVVIASKFGGFPKGLAIHNVDIGGKRKRLLVESPLNDEGFWTLEPLDQLLVMLRDFV